MVEQAKDLLQPLSEFAPSITRPAEDVQRSVTQAVVT